MIIEIRNAELEGLLHQRVAAGKFANVEDMLLETFRAAQAPLRTISVPHDSPGASLSVTRAVDEERKARSLEAADRIRELRKGVTLDRPEGMSLREYAHIGHKY